MSGLTSREDLKQRIGHFSHGTIVAPGGKLMVMFDVDFLVTPDKLMMLNELCSGIRYCEAVHTGRSNHHSVLVQISQGRSQNEAIAIAIVYRNKVNLHLERTAAATPTLSATTKKDSAPKVNTRPKPTMVTFSGPHDTP